MRNYNVWQLAHGLASLTQMQIDAEERLRANGDSPVPVERMNNYYVPLLKLCVAECERVELTAALNRMAPFNLEIRQGISWSELRNQAKTMLEAIHSELCFRRFAFVPTAKATMHDKFGLVWQEIWDKLSEVKEDSQRAIDCYALEQDTACVFHMMRVAEMGLRNIAKKVRVKLTDRGKPLPVEFATWNKVIDGIKSRITAVRAKPKSAGTPDKGNRDAESAPHKRGKARRYVEKDGEINSPLQGGRWRPPDPVPDRSRGRRDKLRPQLQGLAGL